jgi:serine/threonine-protein kinase
MLAGCEVVRSATIEGSGNVVTQEKDFTEFDKVDVTDFFKVNIRQGDSFRVVVRLDDNLVQYLRVVKQGRTLKIGMAPGLRFFMSATREAEVTLPELTGLSLSGASQGTITGFSSTEALDVELSGASHLLGNIDAGDTRFDVSGASQVNLSGSARDVIIDASGASQVKLADFPVEDATVDASGATKVTVNPSGRLDADASGASRVHYLGDPTLGNIDTSGASDVVKPW